MNRLLLAATALTLMIVPAFAQWRSEVQDDDYFVAWVFDDTNTLELNIDCDAGLFGQSVALISGDDWDKTATYPTDAEVAFTVDGEAFTDIAFGFEEVGGKIAAVAYELDQSRVVDLITSLGTAVDPVTVQVMGNQYRFSSEGAMAAVASIQDPCM